MMTFIVSASKIDDRSLMSMSSLLGSMSMLLGSIFRSDRSKSMFPSFLNALASKLNALRMASSSTVKMFSKSRSLPWSSCSSSKVLPVKTSTSRSAFCCFTISESPARFISSYVSSGVYAIPSVSIAAFASSFVLTMPTTFRSMPSSIRFFM